MALRAFGGLSAYVSLRETLAAAAGGGGGGGAADDVWDHGSDDDDSSGGWGSEYDPDEAAEDEH
ncbi:hypothetical protein HK405_001381, partial [Cladochytrium tenue]